MTKNLSSLIKKPSCTSTFLNHFREEKSAITMHPVSTESTLLLFLLIQNFLVIIFSTKTNLLLIELIFRWPIIVFKAFSVLCLRIRRMSLFIEKHDSEFSEAREP